MEALAPPQLTLLHGPAVPHWLSARLCPPCCRDVTPGHTRVTTLRQRQGRHRGAEPITRYLGCLASTLFFLGLHFYLLTFITYDPPVPGTVRNCYLTLTLRFYQLIITSCYMTIGMFHFMLNQWGEIRVYIILKLLNDVSISMCSTFLVLSVTLLHVAPEILCNKSTSFCRVSNIL